MTAAEMMEAHRAVSDERSEVVKTLAGSTGGWFLTMLSAAGAQPSSTRVSSMHAGRTARYMRQVPEPVQRCGFRRASNWLPPTRLGASFVISWRASKTTPLQHE
jgi:hypothetical protein